MKTIKKNYLMITAVLLLIAGVMNLFVAPDMGLLFFLGAIVLIYRHRKAKKAD